MILKFLVQITLKHAVREILRIPLPPFFFWFRITSQYPYLKSAIPLFRYIQLPFKHFTTHENLMLNITSSDLKRHLCCYKTWQYKNDSAIEKKWVRGRKHKILLPAWFLKITQQPLLIQHFYLFIFKETQVRHNLLKYTYIAETDTDMKGIYNWRILRQLLRLININVFSGERLKFHFFWTLLDGWKKF